MLIYATEILRHLKETKLVLANCKIIWLLSFITLGTEIKFFGVLGFL